jgi:hypothetical protein
MNIRFLASAGLRDKNTARLIRGAWKALGTSVVWLAMAACASGQQASAPPAPTTAASTQIPDAPSTTKQQHGSFGHGVATVVKTIGQDELHLITAPFRIDSVGFTNEVPFLNKTLFWDSVVVGATGVLIGNDESVVKQVPISWHQAGIDISNACTYGEVAATGAIYLTGLFTHDEHAQRTGVLAAEASIDSTLLYGSMKLVFNRQRPYMGNGDGKFFYGNFSSGSFPSGHATFAWTLASVVAHEYPKWPVQLLMYGMATTVATTRVTGGQHFPSDVFVGSTLGYLVGRYVANKDKRSQNQTSHGLKQLPNAILSHVTVQ